MQQLNIFHRTLHRQASTQRVVVNGCKEDITNTTYIFVKFSFFSPQLTHTRNWITHQKKSPRHHHILTIKYFSLCNMSVRIMKWYTRRDEKYIIKIYHQGYICSNFFSVHITMRCVLPQQQERATKKTFTSLLHFCDVCRNYMTCERRGERGRQQKKDEECSINYWIFLLKT